MAAHDTQIRRLRPREWRELRDLRLEALRESPNAFVTPYDEAAAYSDDSWRERARETCFVADDGGRLQGMVKAFPRGEESVALASMYVRREARGHGIGERLVAAVVDWARSEGRARVELGVHARNDVAQRLYARCGFTPTGETRRFAGYGVDVRMEREL